jgi:hypothetical protein
MNYQTPYQEIGYGWYKFSCNDKYWYRIKDGVPIGFAFNKSEEIFEPENFEERKLVDMTDVAVNNKNLKEDVPSSEWIKISCTSGEIVVKISDIKLIEVDYASPYEVAVFLVALDEDGGCSYSVTKDEYARICKVLGV